MEDKMVVMVVVAVVADQEDTCWDTVSISRTECMSHRDTVSRNGEFCQLETVALRSTTDLPNGCVGVVNECDPNTCIDKRSCGCEYRMDDLVNYNHTGKPRLKDVIHLETEGLFFAAFLRELQKSLVYRLLVLQHWVYKCKRKCIKASSNDSITSIAIEVKVHDTLPYVMDYACGQRMCRCAQERQHLDTVMSWLSTLGGACSALGDHMSAFAERAWAISLQQLDIALRLGDPNVVSRCKLYAAISLIQRCHFKLAARIIKQEYRWAHSVSPEVRDTRLVKMCQGIWTKLRHERQIYLQQHNCLSLRTT